jgi:hypothetical protein
VKDLLQASMEMLRRGQKAIERQEWEKGETAQEWYFAAGQLAHQIQMEMEFSRDNAKGEVTV